MEWCKDLGFSQIGEVTGCMEAQRSAPFSSNPSLRSQQGCKLCCSPACLLLLLPALTSFRVSRHSATGSEPNVKLYRSSQNIKRKKMEKTQLKATIETVSRLPGSPFQTPHLLQLHRGHPAEPCCQGRALAPLTICHL